MKLHIFTKHWINRKSKFWVKTEGKILFFENCKNFQNFSAFTAFYIKENGILHFELHPWDSKPEPV